MAMEQAMEQHHQRQMERIPLSEKWKSLSPAVDELEINASGGFDCNICLDPVLDPVVTFCGHLYCWPCIYKWIHSQNSYAEDADHQHPQCPVCKAEVSEKTLIPLYGRGLSAKPSEGKAPNLGMVIPQRPPSPRCGGHVLIATATSNNSHSSSQHLHHRSYPQHAPSHQPYPGSYNVAPMLNLSGTATNALNHPMIGMIGEMVNSGMFRNSGSSLYAYPNSYHLAAGTSPRIRRQMLQADRSMGRLCFFLCCCVVICLLLF